MVVGVTAAAGDDAAEGAPSRPLSMRSSLAIFMRRSYDGSGSDGGPGAASSSVELRQGTLAGVVFNTLCNVMGAGILSLPMAMYHASVVTGLILLTACAVASAVASYAVVCACDATGKESFAEVFAFSMWPETPRCHAKRMRRGGFNAADSVKVLRRRAVVVLECIVFLFNFGALIIYSRVIADSLPPVIHAFLGGSGLWTEKWMWLLLSGVVFFALSCVRNMEELKWSSMLGFITIFYVVVVVVIRYATMTDRRPPSDDIHWCGFDTATLKALSSYGLAFGYHYNVPYFYKELRHRSPATFMKSVSIAFPIIFVSYAVTGVLGYLTFGSELADGGGDIVNSYAPDDPLVNVGRLGLFLHFACVFPVLAVCARRGMHRVVMSLHASLGAVRRRRRVSSYTPVPDASHHHVAASLTTLSPSTSLHHPHLSSPAVAVISRGDAPSHDHPAAVVIVTRHSDGDDPLVLHRRSPGDTPLLLETGDSGSTASGGRFAVLQLDPPRRASQSLSETPPAASTPLPCDAPPINPHPHRPSLVVDADECCTTVAAELESQLPGRPEDTTRVAIVIEAFVIVVLAVFLAGVVSGIDVVIDVIGNYLGLTLMLIIPGWLGVLTSRNQERIVGEGLGSNSDSDSTSMGPIAAGKTDNPGGERDVSHIHLGVGEGEGFAYFSGRNDVAVLKSAQRLRWLGRSLLTTGALMVLSGGILKIVNDS